MSMDNVQLKQEDAFGDHVVLSDINPVSNTKSIDNDDTGEKLNETLSRLWEAINNKLSRYVNSVNGRTGVVVLNSDDVGLGNVDNVSFADIKSWVINEIENAFKNKQLHMYDTYTDAFNAAATNDRTLAWAPFYCDKYGESDRRSVIGVFTWNDSSSTLDLTYRMINTIGYADESILYRTSASDYPTENDGLNRDIPVGGIGVNIYQEERPEDQVLFLERGGSKAVSGLRIDNEKIGSRVYYEDTPYGEFNPETGLPSVEPGGYMLWRYKQGTGQGADYKGYKVRIFIDGHEITPKFTTVSSTNPEPEEYTREFYIDNRWVNYASMRNNDIVVMRFSNFIRDNDTTSAGVCLDLSRCQPAVGRIVKSSNPEFDYDIYFQTLNPNTNGYGLMTMETHQNRDVKSTQLGVNILTSRATPDGRIGHGAYRYANGYPVNMSGIMTYAGEESVKNTLEHRNPNILRGIHTPWSAGISSGISVYELPEDPSNKGSMHISTDGTLCTYPYYQALATRLRAGVAPEWISGKFYQKNGDSYEVLTSEPAGWNYLFFMYYVKDENDAYVSVSGIKQAYSAINFRTYEGDPTKQLCVGSLMASNAVFDNQGYSLANDYNSVYYPKDGTVGNPAGLDQSDFIGGTQASIGINLYKVSSSLYAHDPNATVDSVDMFEHVKEKFGYQFFNLSGIRMNFADWPYDAGNVPIVDSGSTHQFDPKMLYTMGLHDYKDAYGNDRKSYIVPGSFSDGISINVGRFLEITPKKTYRAEKYWEGGKVQVRVGPGMTEEVVQYDVTDVVKNGKSAMTADMPFTYDELVERWFTTGEEFVLWINEYTQHLGTVIHNQLDSTGEEPEDWEDEWYRYEYNVGTEEDPEYVFLPKIPGQDIGFNVMSPTYMGPYYEPNRAGVLGGCMTFADLRNNIFNSNRFSSAKLIWNRPTNRLTPKLDPETLAINESGQITVIGGANDALTTNIRIIDPDGFYADTYHDDDRDDKQPPHTEHILLGDGLALVGGDVQATPDLRIETADKRINRKVRSIWDALSTFEYSDFIAGNPYNYFDIAVPNAITLAWLIEHKTELGNQIDTKSASQAYLLLRSLNSHATQFRDKCDDTENTLTFGDETYNIAPESFKVSEVRLYMAQSLTNVIKRATDIINAVPQYVPDASNALKLYQYIADHYSLGQVSGADQLISHVPEIMVYNNHTSQFSNDLLPLDWLFGFFARTILNSRGWEKIITGTFDYDPLEYYPAGWTPSGFGDYFWKDSENVYHQIENGTFESRYAEGVYYTRDAGTGTFSLITTFNQSDVVSSYYIQNRYVKQDGTNVTQPADWNDAWAKYYYTDDATDPKLFKHVTGSTAPEWVANTYYTEKSDGDVVGYEKVYTTCAFSQTERGTLPPEGSADPGNFIPCAPIWSELTVYDSDSSETPQESQPADWYTNYANYFTRTGEVGSYVYTNVEAAKYYFKTCRGTYYSRTLTPSNT